MQELMKNSSCQLEYNILNAHIAKGELITSLAFSISTSITVSGEAITSFFTLLFLSSREDIRAVQPHHFNLLPGMA